MDAWRTARDFGKPQERAQHRCERQNLRDAPLQNTTGQIHGVPAHRVGEIRGGHDAAREAGRILGEQYGLAERSTAPVGVR